MYNVILSQWRVTEPLIVPNMRGFKGKKLLIKSKVNLINPLASSIFLLWFLCMWDFYQIIPEHVTRTSLITISIAKTLQMARTYSLALERY